MLKILYNFSCSCVAQTKFGSAYASEEQLNTHTDKKHKANLLCTILYGVLALVWELLGDNNREKVTSGSEVGVE